MNKIEWKTCERCGEQTVASRLIQTKKNGLICHECKEKNTNSPKTLHAEVEQKSFDYDTPFEEIEALKMELIHQKEQIAEWASAIQSVSDNMPRGFRDISLKEIAGEMREASK